MMAEKARLFLDHGAAERIMASSDPREHKRLGRGVHNCDCAVWDRVREDAVLAGAFANFTRNLAMKQHLLSTGTKSLAEANPIDPVGGIGLREDDPEAQGPSRWRGKKMLGKALSAVHDALRVSEAGLAHPASSHQFCTPTTPDRIQEISPAPPRPLAVAIVGPGPPLEFSTFFSDAPADHSPEVLLSPLVSTPPSRCQNTAPASSGAILPSTTPLLQTTSRFTFIAKLAFLQLLVAWRFLTLAPHRLSFDEMFWIACVRLMRYPSRTSRNAPSFLGGVWRIGPSENFDECAPERPILSGT